MKYLILLIHLVAFKLSFSQNFTKFTIDDTFGSTRGIEIGDFNNDSHMDLVAITSEIGAEIACWFNDGSGNFGTKVTIDIDQFADREADDVNVIDINNDGFLDIVTVKFNGIVWYQNNQNESFGSTNFIDSDFGAGFFSDEILIFDVDNNNFDDIIISYDDNIFYYPNLGNGTFGSKVSIKNFNARGMTANLFNNDNFNDLVVTQFAGNSFYSANLGNGTFDSLVQINTTTDSNFLQSNFIKSSKIDNDDFFDIVVSDLQGRLIWNSGNNDGTFDDFKIISEMEHPRITHIAIDDLDNDGDNDIVVTTFLSSDLLWWENDGNGNFGSTKIVNSETYGNYDVKITDVDEDGIKDIIISNPDGVFWFKRNQTLSINDFSIESNTSFYPNPSNGQIFFTNSSNANKVQVYDINGKHISDSQINNSNTHLKINIPGLYIIKIISDSGIQLKKIIIK